MGKKKYNGPNFVPNAQPKMSCAEKDNLFAHLIRRKGFFEEGLARLPLGILKAEDYKYRVILRACHDLAKNPHAMPGNKQFRGRLKDEIRKIAQELDQDELVVEAAEEIAGEGGFIDEAYLVDKGDLSDALAHALLERFLYEVEIVWPLENLLTERLSSGNTPKDLAEVLEKLQERLRKHDSIEPRPSRRSARSGTSTRPVSHITGTRP